MSEHQPGSLSDRRAAYAAWRDRLRSKSVIDLTEEDETPTISDEWSPEALFKPAPASELEN